MADLTRFAERNPVLLRELRDLAYRQPQELVGGERYRILDLDQLPWLREHQQRAYQMRANLSLEQSLLEPHLIRT